MARGDEAEHEIGRLGVGRDIADVVDDDQRNERTAGGALPRGCPALCIVEPPHPFSGSGERDRAGQPCRRRPRWLLAGAGRAQQDDVLLTVEKVQLSRPTEN
jgi:hypothetical protein